MKEILWERNPAPGKLEVMSVYDWPVWEKEVSRFDWTYERAETCYFLEGRVVVTPDGGDPVEFAAGDLVSFPAGLACVWEVLEPVRKHYLLEG